MVTAGQMTKPHQKCRKVWHGAFSLVELSIVLVILGLLTGGILSGQSLIRASELRAVTTEYQQYMAAVQSFRDRYMALPGDIRNATNFWGNATTGTTGGECTSAATTQGTGTQTCNGNGDGTLNGTGNNEIFRFWQHLANAGLIEGTYTGIRGPETGTTHHMLFGINIPKSRVSNAGWGTRYVPAIDTNSTQFAIPLGSWLQFGAQQTDDNYGSVLRPEEAWNIDTKVDDGKPARGKMVARRFSSCTNAANASDLDSDYQVSSSTIGCVLLFPNFL